MLIVTELQEDVVEYNYCPFCGKKKWGKRKSAILADEIIEWFICFDCDREII